MSLHGLCFTFYLVLSSGGADQSEQSCVLRSTQVAVTNRVSIADALHLIRRPAAELVVQLLSVLCRKRITRHGQRSRQKRRQTPGDCQT